jgi:VanZ family protein
VSVALRWHKAWLALWLFGMVLGIYLSLRPSGAEMPAIPFADKLIHASGYGLLAVLAVCLFERRSRWNALLWLLCLGGMIEFAQGLLPTGRMMEAADVLANAIGIAVGAGLCWRWNGLRWIEQILIKP